MSFLRQCLTSANCTEIVGLTSSQEDLSTENDTLFQLSLAELRERLQSIEQWRHLAEVLYTSGFGRKRSSTNNNPQETLISSVSLTQIVILINNTTIWHK